MFSPLAGAPGSTPTPFTFGKNKAHPFVMKGNH
jgi:hypothetical protein